MWHTDLLELKFYFTTGQNIDMDDLRVYSNMIVIIKKVQNINVLWTVIYGKIYSHSNNII